MTSEKVDPLPVKEETEKQKPLTLAEWQVRLAVWEKQLYQLLGGLLH